ncbi:MAG: SprT-like domain-containing protein [Candidatus Thiodiazotropha sp. (ex Semelilucina semeliformis)]|nr:SprT-like domain-containing protein [Candidatus Thiodiazotropha sp. (ex Myrtea spinifera)]MCU7807442.1 SprT-like domain-containing protein [Candidatus Thiodiazotropha sp. (ex Semelilucina semeliformis)]MCU7829315.1 SprT-like domain-containing protein [Candidatus Thiodiazotropha sp. (ex Myrtea sp. 'scaly one' KF741663)]
MDSNQLEQLVLDKTRTLIASAENQYHIRLVAPEIRFDLRGKAAGMVVFNPRSSKSLIRYNAQMLNENGQDFIHQTVPHEVAHLVARVLHGVKIRPHGREWKSIMNEFGAKPKRCHNFSTQSIPTRRMRYFPYRCSCSNHQLSAIRHRRTLSGVIYLCRACGSPLTSS